MRNCQTIDVTTNPVPRICKGVRGIFWWVLPWLVLASTMRRTGGSISVIALLVSEDVAPAQVAVLLGMGMRIAVMANLLLGLARNRGLHGSLVSHVSKPVEVLTYVSLYYQTNTPFWSTRSCAFAMIQIETCLPWLRLWRQSQIPLRCTACNSKPC